MRTVNQGQITRASVGDQPAEQAADRDAIRALAVETVDRLNQRLPVGPTPEDDPAWNAEFVGAIRELKERFRGSPDLRPLLSIASEQLYGREIHWALELIQNAEDAGARRISFLFEPEQVLVQNDGEAFNAGDVWAISSAGHSTKKNKIGFFGIGFKSVFKLTDAPEVRSGPYAFRIEDKIYPEALRADKPRRGARFVLPVRASEATRLASITEQLTGPEFLHLLLTLDSLEEIVIVDRVGGRGRGRFYRRQGRAESRRGWDECHIGGSWPGCEEQSWRRYRYATSAIPPGIARQGREVTPGETSTIVLARPTDRPVGPTSLHCFLPLDVQSELQWLVQADFDPTPGRERLRENDWNRWLLDEVGSFIAAAVEAEARSGSAPWPLIPLSDEVSPGSIQRHALDRAIAGLRERPFVRTAAGWRTPDRAVWADDPDFRDIVREADLAVATGETVSYIAASTTPSPGSPEELRMRAALETLGGRSIAIPDLISLLDLGDRRFGRRDGRWWLRALNAIATRATPSEREAVAATKCLPIEGGSRVRPSPRVAVTGYLVAYARSATITDLRRYFTESEIHLVDPYLDPTPGVLKARRRGGEQGDVRARIREMLSQEPFRVALEAGPYHVVTDLILPRMAALAQLETLDAGQRDQLFRMVEFIRHRWRGYVSDYRRARRAPDETVIARQLGDGLRIVARVGSGRAIRHAARPLTSTYVSSAVLGHDGMDIVLGGKPDVAVIDEVHSQTLPVPRGRGIQRGARAQMPPLEFLRFLGALVGPSALPRNGESFGNGTTVTRVGQEQAPWVRWPSDAVGRPTGIIDDWVSDDIAWLVRQWPELSMRQKGRRAQALWNVIAADWHRLSSTTRATPAHFYYNWIADPPEVPTSWVGNLLSITWVGAQDGSLRSPADLVRPTQATRLALAKEPWTILGWSTPQDSMPAGLGIQERPAPERVIATLLELRDAPPELPEEQRRRAASACYELLSLEVASRDDSARSDLVRFVIRPKFQGNGRTGLIFAPPPGGLLGKAWWPPTRTVRADVSVVAGPFVGQLASRHPRSAALWDALAIRSDLDPPTIGDAIRHELASGAATDEAVHHFYGELVVRLQSLVSVESEGPRDVPALTRRGWVDADDAWWTNRPELRSALDAHVAWWSPGTYDPSILQAAARWLGIRELSAGEALQEHWSIVATEELRSDLRDRWLAAVRAWPELLRSEGGWDRDVVAALTETASGVRPATALHIEGRLTVSLDGAETIAVGAQPEVILRDGVVVARGIPDLFGHDAAELLGSLAPSRQLAATSTLEALLGEAFRSPESFARRIERYAAGIAWLPLQQGFAEPEVEDEDPDAIEAAVEAIRQAAPPATPAHTQAPASRQPWTERIFADPSDFELEPIERTERPGPAPVLEPPSRAKRRRGKAPRPESERPNKRPEDSNPIPPNTAVEDAARPYVEKFEMRRGGHAVHRQGALVGADYVADDGRYIEVKASGGVAEDAFNLEPSEWEAALDPTTGRDYWVYVVEHLTDGGEPVVTAVFNPVRDAALRQAPVGKMKVSGWRDATLRDRGKFRRLEQASDLEG